MQSEYLPIEEYGLIGDLHTAALVGTNGSIDWLCLPRFDSPSVFGAILDAEKGGSFRIWPRIGDVTYKQFYWPETNVLVTRFLTDEGAAELIDFMPVGAEHPPVSQHEIIRRVTAVRGSMTLRMRCQPAFDYARARHRTTLGRRGARFETDELVLGLATDVALQRDGDAAIAEFTLHQGETAVFALRVLDDEGYGEVLSTDHADASFHHTVEYWRDWLSRCEYTGRWREIIHRSLLTLKLLTYAPTGATIAAPTTSLPEGIGGERNWDYRYSWIRDSAFTLYSFLRYGYRKEAADYVSFLQTVCAAPSEGVGPLQVMYGIDGRSHLEEQCLDHLDGYRGSRPVRIGNGAYGQLQIDIYGELLDALYLYNKWGAPLAYDTWLSIRSYVDWVAENWQRPDEGIWEVRGGRRDFLYSKLMCWVALDRALRLAQRRSFPGDIGRWTGIRDAICHEIMDRGFNREIGAFTQSYGSRHLDASVLMMPLTLFVAPTDPRWLGTLEAMMQPPSRGGLLSNSLVFRYNVDETDDGLDGEEGTFNICTFWLVEALTRAGRYRPDLLEQARLMFERMLGFANHLGLYAEETGARGQALGNFPQAFTHLALLSAAYNLDKALGSGA